MNEDIIRMAKQVGMEQDGDNFFSRNYEEIDVHIDDLKRLVELAKAEEREACARVCEDLDGWNEDDPGSSAAKAIRARGKK